MKILNEISNFCEDCPSRECCPEYECVLYRIEKILTKKTYQIEIQEKLSRVIDVKAEHESEAIRIVKEMYRNEKIVLTSDDFVNCEIKVYGE